MTIASGLYKQLAYKIESAYGVAPGQSAGQLLRRVESTIDLTKDTYESNEKRTDFQVADYRHGVRRVAGKVSGELSAKTYADFLGVLLKRDFAAVTALSGVGITIGTAVAGVYPITRTAGSWLTDSAKVGDVIQLNTGTLNALNITKNILITDITSATVIQGIAVNGSALFPEGPVTGCGVAWPGKKTYVPLTGHTDKSIAFEHWYVDLVQSELFLGNKISKASVQLPPTGMATISFDVMGQDMADSTADRGGVALTAQYFTSPTAQTTTATLAAVNGLLRAGGSTYATITGLSFDIDASYAGDPVVGANVVPQLFPGKLKVTGQFTAYFDSVTLRDAFVNETEIDLIAVFTADNTASAHFVSFVMPRIKVGSANKDDSDNGLTQTFSFQALLNVNGGTGIKTEKTTLSVQDSAA